MKMGYFYRIAMIIALLLVTTIKPAWAATQKTHYIPLLKEMFTKVTQEKNDKAIPLYYDKDFLLYTNGNTETYEQFLKQHQAIYKTPVKYQIRYDEDTLVEQGNRVAARVLITTQQPKETARVIEVLLIAEFKGNKIYRLWELTSPDWSKMDAFKKFSANSGTANVPAAIDTPSQPVRIYQI